MRRRLIQLLRKVAIAAPGGVRLATLLLLVYWIAIFTGTHLPRLPTGVAVQVSDKAMHFGAFIGLGFLLCWAIPNRLAAPRRVKYWAAAIGLAYGAFDELTQLLVGGRTCSLLDLLADAAGIAVGITAYVVLRRFLLAAEGCFASREPAVPPVRTERC